MRNPELANQAAHMRELIGSPAWVVFQSIVNKRIAAKMDQLVTIQADDFKFLQGHIQGIQEIMAIPQQIVNRSKAQNV